MLLRNLLYALLVFCICGCPAQRKNKDGKKKPDVSQSVVEDGIPKPTPPASVVPLTPVDSSFVSSLLQPYNEYRKSEKSFALMKPLIERPFAVCGTRGSIADRVADCREKNSQGELKFEFNGTTKAWWSLVARGGDGSEVWRDNLTGLVWSDVIGWENDTEYSWCHASGSNNKPGSPFADGSIDNFCLLPNRQNQEKPISLCAEDVQYLGGTTKSNPAKGGLGKLKGATTPVTWWLPTHAELSVAETHGLNQIAPHRGDRSQDWEFGYFTYGGFWTSDFFGVPESNTVVRHIVAIGFLFFPEATSVVLKKSTGGSSSRTIYQDPAKVRCVGAP